MILRFRFAAFLVLAGFALAVSGADKGPAFKQENKPENLKAFLELIHNTVHVKKDNKQAVAMFQSLIPDEGRAKKALKDNVAPDALQGILDLHKKLRSSISEESITKMVRSIEKNVKVYAATTEEIKTYREGSVAQMEFAGGTKRVAEQALRPGMTFYTAEYLEPGKNSGMKYHLLYWDGKQWSMLGPAWRVLKEDKK